MRNASNVKYQTPSVNDRLYVFVFYCCAIILDKNNPRVLKNPRFLFDCCMCRGLSIPGLAQIPVPEPIFFQHNVIVYIGFLLAPLAWFYIYRTRRGLESRAIGEYPAAADVLGIQVYAQRYAYVILGGVLAGMSGAALSLAITPLKNKYR